LYIRLKKFIGISTSGNYHIKLELL